MVSLIVRMQRFVNVTSGNRLKMSSFDVVTTLMSVFGVGWPDSGRSASGP